MKKSRFASLLFLAPVALLCSCKNVVQFSFTANWYKNTAITTVGDTMEKLEYKVTFTPNETETFSVQYDDGVYTTELKNENLTLSGGTVTKEGYSYSTSLTISGRYTLNGKTGETFHDKLTSTVKFLPVGDKLQPIESKKEVTSTSPISAAPSSLETATTVYHYTYETVYDADMKNAHITYTDLSGEAPVKTEKTVKTESKYTYLDNEEIAFALRGVNFASSAATTFTSINPVTNTALSLKISASAVKEQVAFVMDGKEVKSDSLDAYSVQLSYDTTYSGQPQTLVFAALTDPSNNTYRNVMLTMKAPILQSLGTMVYTLTKAEFSTKS